MGIMRNGYGEARRIVTPQEPTLITVEFDVFSGRPNPQWELTESETAEFSEILIADLSVVRPMLSIPATLGPRGFIVILTGEHALLFGSMGVPSSFRITSLPVDETFLSADLSPASTGDTEPVQEDSSSRAVAPAFSAAAACSLAYTSWNDFSFWNGSRVLNNNCYCFAANYASNVRFSRPGRQGGNPLPGGVTYAQRPSPTQFRTSMRADGWTTACNGSSLRIVGLLGRLSNAAGDTSWDYHFYRKSLNDSGVSRWAQKSGGGPATNRDYSGNFMPTVEGADRARTVDGITYNYNEIIDTFFSPAGQRSVVVR